MRGHPRPRIEKPEQCITGDVRGSLETVLGKFDSRATGSDD